MKRKIILSTLGVAVVVCIAFTSVALADWVSYHDYLWQTFNHGWGKGAVERDDYWDQYWDSGQGRYTQYRIQPSSYGYILVSSDSVRWVLGVYAYLIRSDSSEKDYIGADVWVQQGEDFTKYWPPSQEVFAKPVSNDPSCLSWVYQWPKAIQSTKYNWTDYPYAEQTYYYDYTP